MPEGLTRNALKAGLLFIMTITAFLLAACDSNKDAIEAQATVEFTIGVRVTPAEVETISMVLEDALAKVPRLDGFELQEYEAGSSSIAWTMTPAGSDDAGEAISVRLGGYTNMEDAVDAISGMFEGVRPWRRTNPIIGDDSGISPRVESVLFRKGHIIVVLTPPLDAPPDATMTDALVEFATLIEPTFVSAIE